MSQRPITPQREKPTEYRLSISSNPSSRRSSLGNTVRDPAASNQTMIDRYILPQLQELADSITTLDSNMTHMNFIHESITDLNESLSSLLYGLMCNSWCVDFPKISHDTPHELQLLHKLRQLNEEKELLLSKLKPESSPQQIPTKTPIVRLPPSALYPQHSNGKHINTDINNNNKDENADDDDDNTAASFVSNPTNFTVHSPSQQLTENSQPSLAHHKLRRRSILHQIRNNAASASTPIEKNLSLATSARRIPIDRASRQTVTSLRSSTRPKPKSLSNRPPFR